jgi:hypothetical protein
MTGFLPNNDQINKIQKLLNQWLRGSLGERSKDMKSLLFWQLGWDIFSDRLQERSLQGIY